MKLSDIRGERTLDVIASIIEPLISIAQDKEATEFLHVRELKPEENANTVAMERISKCVPLLLSRHKNEVCEILASLEGVPYYTYVEKLNIAKLAKDCIDILSDTEFFELFMSAQSTPASSGSAQENTTGDH